LAPERGVATTATFSAASAAPLDRVSKSVRIVIPTTDRAKREREEGSRRLVQSRFVANSRARGT
jgi:hypothetical protein